MRRVQSGFLTLIVIFAGMTTATSQVTEVAPDLARTMTSLETKLRTTGRVTWAWDSNQGRRTDWEELLSISADPANCSLRAAKQTSYGSQSVSFYLEEVSGVYKYSSKDSVADIRGPLMFASYPNTQPPYYSVAINNWSTTQDFLFPSAKTAEEFAALLREAVKQCSATAVSPRPAPAGRPTLAETLSFIADKLGTQGQVDFPA